MKKQKYRSFEELPLMLNVNEVAAVMGLSVAGTYELVRSESFPSFKVGSRILVPKDKFIDWIHARTTEKSSSYLA